MQVYYELWLDPHSSRPIDLKRDLGIEGGAKQIAIGSRGGLVSFAWSRFAIPDSDKCGIQHFKFPVINGKSPCLFQVDNDSSEDAEVFLLVEELGGCGAENYFTGDL